MSHLVFMNPLFHSTWKCGTFSMQKSFFARQIIPYALKYTFIEQDNELSRLINAKSAVRRKSVANALKKTKLFINCSYSTRRNERIFVTKWKNTKNRIRKRMALIVERENVWTIPNILCISRIAVSPYIGYLILHSQYSTAIYLLIYAGVTDLLDGFIARRWKEQASKLGSFLDPLADKILVATLFLSLTYADLMPVALTSIIIARDVSLAAAGFWIRYKSLPPPRTLSRYFDATHATAQLAPTTISKFNTACQLFTCVATLSAPLWDLNDHPFLFYLWCLTGATTVASAASYVIQKKTYHLLKKNF